MVDNPEVTGQVLRVRWLPAIGRLGTVKKYRTAWHPLRQFPNTNLLQSGDFTSVVKFEHFQRSRPMRLKTGDLAERGDSNPR
jgi:hypothetical protein